MSVSGLIEQERYTCAIGALQSVVAIPRAVPILHSGPGCGTMVLGFYERGTGYAGGYTSPCTNFSETEVVFGGTERLRSIIANSYKVLDTDLQVVLTGCTADIVGDDVASVVSEFSEDGRPIVSVETAGFKHNNFVAHSNVVNAIIDQYVDRFSAEHPSRSRRRLVNLFASLPYQDPFWKGNLREYKRLLEALGLEVNILFGPASGGVAEWQSIPAANFNILVSPWYGLPIVQNLEQKYGQPYFHFPYLPIGANETTRFLTQLADFANSLDDEGGLGAAEYDADGDGDGDVEQGGPQPLVQPALLHSLIQAEERAFYEEIDNLATFLLEFRYGLPNHVHVFHDAGYVLGLAKFLLHEVGIVPKEQYVLDNTPPEFQQRLQELLAETSDKRHIPVSFDPDAGAAQRALRAIYPSSAERQDGGRGKVVAASTFGGGGAPGHEGRGLIIGSGWDKELARDLDCDFLPAAAPCPYRLVLTSNYVGFSGGLRVIEDIYDVVLASYA